MRGLSLRIEVGATGQTDNGAVGAEIGAGAHEAPRGLDSCSSRPEERREVSECFSEELLSPRTEQMVENMICGTIERCLTSFSGSGLGPSGLLSFEVSTETDVDPDVKLSGSPTSSCGGLSLDCSKQLESSLSCGKRKRNLGVCGSEEDVEDTEAQEQMSDTSPTSVEFHSFEAAAASPSKRAAREEPNLIREAHLNNCNRSSQGARTAGSPSGLRDVSNNVYFGSDFACRQNGEMPGEFTRQRSDVSQLCGELSELNASKLSDLGEESASSPDEDGTLCFGKQQECHWTATRSTVLHGHTNPQVFNGEPSTQNSEAPKDVACTA